MKLEDYKATFDEVVAKGPGTIVFVHDTKTMLQHVILVAEVVDKETHWHGQGVIMYDVLELSVNSGGDFVRKRQGYWQGSSDHLMFWAFDDHDAYNAYLKHCYANLPT